MGPIRSLRPVDSDLLPAVSAVVISTGGQPFVMREVEAAGTATIVAGFSSLFPGVGNPSPYDTFVDLELLEAAVDESLLPAGGLPVGELPEGQPAENVELPFSDVSLRYQEGFGYVRYQGDSPFEVLDTNGSNSSPLRHDTVVVLFAGRRSAGYTDSNGAPVSNYDVIGSGSVLVFSQGRVVEGEWKRASLRDPYLFTDSSGVEFGLSTGRVYLAIMDRDSHVGYWREVAQVPHREFQPANRVGLCLLLSRLRSR